MSEDNSTLKIDQKEIDKMFFFDKMKAREDCNNKTVDLYTSELLD